MFNKLKCFLGFHDNEITDMDTYFIYRCIRCGYDRFEDYEGFTVSADIMLDRELREIKKIINRRNNHAHT